MRHNFVPSLIVPAVIVTAPAYAIDYLNIAQARHQLFPDANAFEERALSLSRDERSAIKRRAGTRQRNDLQRFWDARKDDEMLGWVLVDDVIGKHEFITYAVAITAEGSVAGLEILSYRETHGGEVRESGWREQFVGRTIDDPLRLGKDVTNISGATLSCRNLTDGVKRLLVIWDMFIGPGQGT